MERGPTAPLLPPHPRLHKACACSSSQGVAQACCSSFLWFLDSTCSFFPSSTFVHTPTPGAELLSTMLQERLEARQHGRGLLHACSGRLHPRSQSLHFNRMSL